VPPESGFNRWARIGIHGVYEAISAGIFAVVSFALYILFFEKGEAAYVLGACVLIAAYYIRILAFFLQIVFSPASAALRIAPVADDAARLLNSRILAAAGIGFLFAVAANFFALAVENMRVYLVFYNLAGISVTLAAMAIVWEMRRPVANAARRRFSDTDGRCSALQERLIRHWHIGAILYILLVGLFWEIALVMGAHHLVDRLLLSFLLIPAYLFFDHWGDRMIRLSSDRIRASAEEKSKAPGATNFETGESSRLDKPEAPPPMIPRHRYSTLIRKTYRTLLAAAVFFVVLKLWGIDWAFGRVVTRTLFAVIVVAVLAFLAWEAVKTAIDRKMKEIAPGTEEDMEEGGAGGSRIGTLLMLLKKFILVFMVVIVVMIVLSALGVNIGPLIAGAGVMGLAIGFGAQTLVKDIISGIFFLIDDAFRVGDYVDAGKVKGLVEHISIRSLRLRHHRGMVHTIPFGELSSVTNFSRDYIITKLTFRVRYDTDVDQVRKIVKDIDKEIQKDEEMGAALFGNIKSQGVRELDDSAMIMRVKFKCVPGQQFIIRREVYRLLKEKFTEKGIQFAHRNVTVYLPPEETAISESPVSSPDDPPTLNRISLSRKAAAAAALAASVSDEESET
jgi:small-conductance mechanosensitive channel